MVFLGAHSEYEFDVATADGTREQSSAYLFGQALDGTVKAIRDLTSLIPAAILAIAGLVAILYVGSGFRQFWVAVTIILMGYALSWNIVSGYAGQLSFGHSLYFGIGAYSTVLIPRYFELPPATGLLVGAILAGLAALFVGALTLRLSGLYFALSTVIFPLALLTVMVYLQFHEVPLPLAAGGGFAELQFGDPRILSGLCLMVTVFITVVCCLIERSATGTLWRAIKSDEIAARAAGTNATPEKVKALVLSGVFGGLTGALYPAITFIVTPEQVFGLPLIVEPVILSLVGGMGTVWGPIFGASLLVPTTHFLDSAYGARLPGISALVYGLLLLIVTVKLPAGIYWSGRPLVRKFARKFGGDEWTEATTVSRRSSTATPAATGVAPNDNPGVGAADSLAEQGGHQQDLGDPGQPLAPPQGRDGETAEGHAGPRNDDRQEDLLEIIAVSKHFGGLEVLRDVTFSVRQGEIVGLIGPNGAGKTTLFNIVNGLLHLDGGRVWYRGQDVTHESPHRLFIRGLGRTFQTVRIFEELSVQANVEVPAINRARAGTLEQRSLTERADEALELLRLSHKANDPIESLSTGELRRMELARAFAGGCELLLLDEFLGGLGGADASHLLHVIEAFKQRGISILAVEHTVHALMNVADRLVVLDGGVIIANGPPGLVARDPEVIRAYLGQKWADRHVRD